MSRQADDDDHTLDQYRYHMSIIGDAISSWRAGATTTYAKRRVIADENNRYYAGTRKSPITGEPLTSMPRVADLTGILGDVTGVPRETIAAALAARKDASVLAQQILDDGGTHEAAAMVRGEGVLAYQDILRAAQPTQQETR